MLDCIKSKTRDCQHEWRILHVSIPMVRARCVKCGKKKTAIYTALSFLQCWVKPYLDNPAAFAKYRKTVDFFEANKKTIFRDAREEILQEIEAAKRKKEEMETLQRFCQAAAAALL